MHTPALRARASSGAILAAALTLAACGGSSPSSNAAKERASEQQAETRNVDFAKCMREHGVNAEAVTGPGGGHGLKVSPGPGGPATVEVAEKACARYQPKPESVNLSPQQRVQREEAVQKFAKCMREHGIKVEARAKGAGIQIGIQSRAGSGGPNPESPGFQQAQSTCQRLLPGPPGGGPRPSLAPRASGAKGPGSPGKPGLFLSAGG